MGSTSRIDIQELLESRRFCSFHWKVLLLCVATVVMDGFDIVAIGFIAPALVTDWKIPREALGPVMTFSLLGLTCGGLLGGPLADRVGRRKVIISSVLFFGLMSLLSVLSHDIVTLSFLRFFTGLGLGASQPNAATLVSEYAPKRFRSVMVTTVYCGFSIGAAGGGFLASYLIPAYGWKSVLLAGGILPIVFSWLLIWLLPESARFLAIKESGKKRLACIVNAIEPGLANDDTIYVTKERANATKGTIRQIVSRPHSVVTYALWLGLFANVFVVYLLNSWLPIMVKGEGFSLSDAAIVGAMLQLGGAFGNIIIGWEMDRCNPHTVMIGTLFAGGVVAVALGYVPLSMTVLMIMCFLIGYTINATNTGWTALATGYYPTEVRATGTSWMTGIGRIGAIVGVFLGAVMMNFNWAFGQVFLALSVPTAIAMACAYLKGWHQPLINRSPREIAEH